MESSKPQQSITCQFSSYSEELKKCQEHVEELQQDKDAVSKEIEEAQSQTNM